MRRRRRRCSTIRHTPGAVPTSHGWLLSKYAGPIYDSMISPMDIMQRNLCLSILESMLLNTRLHLVINVFNLLKIYVCNKSLKKLNLWMNFHVYLRSPGLCHWISPRLHSKFGSALFRARKSLMLGPNAYVSLSLATIEISLFL